MHSASVVIVKMVRKQRKFKEEPKLCRIEPRVTRSNSTAAENFKKKLFVTIKPTQIESKVNSRTKNIQENSTARVTRSKSVNAEAVISIDSTCALPNFSPKRTRSKSEKTSKIDSNSNFNHREKIEQKEERSQNSKISVISHVKLCDFSVDSIVLAKQKYSVAWPAQVLKIEKKRVFVYFFGDKRRGYVDKSEIYDFILSVNAIKNTLKSKKKQRTYVTGIREVEMLMGIPHGQSLIK